MPKNDETDFLFESDEDNKPSSTDEEVYCTKKKISRSEPIRVDQTLEAGYYRIDVKNLDMLPRVVIPAEWGMSLKDKEGKILKTLSSQQIGNRSAGPLIRGSHASPEASITFKVQPVEAPARLEARVSAKILVGGVLMTARLVKLAKGDGAQSPAPPTILPIAAPSSPAPKSPVVEDSMASSFENEDGHSPVSRSDTSESSIKKKRSSFAWTNKVKKDSVSTPTQPRSTGLSNAPTADDEAVQLIEKQYMKLPKGEKKKMEVFDLVPGTYRVEVVEDTSGLNQLKKHLSDVTCKLRVYMNDANRTMVKEYKTTQAMNWTYYFRVPPKVQGQKNCPANLALDFKSQAMFLSQRYTVYLHKMPSNTEIKLDDDVSVFETKFKIASALMGLCMLKLAIDILSYPILSVNMLDVVTLDVTLFKILMVCIPSWAFINFSQSKYMIMKAIRHAKKMKKEFREMQRMKELKKAAEQSSGFVDKLKNIKGAMVKMNEEIKDEKLKDQDMSMSD